MISAIDRDRAPSKAEDARAERRRQGDGKRGLGVGAQDEARQRDADLRGGDVPAEAEWRRDVRHQPAREAVAVVAQALDAAPPRAHGAKLGADVEGIRKNEDCRHEPGGSGHEGNILRGIAP